MIWEPWPAGAGSEPFSMTISIENSRFLGSGRQEPDRSNSYYNFIRNSLIWEPWPAGAGSEPFSITILIEK